ncbi:NADP-dependent oxidoreductase domain-containing protein [Fusarium acuminatum]|uniref:NADP-dependent oxidoreductase domain-containing protein n=1 Tax=Fusarium acuminatum TaxID=5515 RepID=A0ABZ2X4R8_9HYPO
MSFGRTVTLNSGYKIPQIGYGTWQAAPGEVGNGVYEALKAGYRHLDLAKIYQNQREVGEGIKKAISEVDGLKREDIFITGKLWNNKHRPEEVAGALDDSLEELGLEYLDLWLIHWPVAFKNGDELFPLKEGDDSKTALDQGVTLSQTWEAVTKLPKEKVRSIGVSNFNKEMLETIIKDTGVTPAINQIERHPRLPQPELVAYQKEKGIYLTAYSAFGNNSWGEPLLINTPEVKAVAERLTKSKGKEVTPAQVILAWSTLDNHIVIPKSVTPARIRSNFEEVELDEEAIKELAKFGEKPQRFNIPKTYKPDWDIDVFGDEKEKSASNKVVLKL